jgi:hypothetical protein
MDDVQLYHILDLGRHKRRYLGARVIYARDRVVLVWIFVPRSCVHRS